MAVTEPGMRRVTREQLLMSLMIWIRLAPRGCKADLTSFGPNKDTAERRLAEAIVSKLELSKHEVIAPEPSVGLFLPPARPNLPD